MRVRDALRDLEARIPTRMVPDLDRIRDLADLMGDPQRTYPSIHITGTNGKTSIARMITALLSSLGLQTGTYTSPHLQSVRERIRVAGRPIDDDTFAEVHAAIAPLAGLVDERHDDRVTYFELLTAMAYWWFADHPVDVGVFEVGMGGTWDATNLVRGEVAVLNTVDVDHPELGATSGEVAREKAGIIKPRAAVVCAPQPPDAAAIIRQTVRDQGATLIRVGSVDGGDEEVEVAPERRRIAVGGQVLTLRTPERRYTDVFLPLHGAHQADNAAVALAALHGFLGGSGDVGEDIVREGFAALEVPGRLEVVQRHPTVLLDGAHNPAGARRTASAVTEDFTFRDVILVAACLADKDIDGILGPFRDVASHVVVTRAPSTRAAPVEAMAAAAQRVWQDRGVVIEVADTVAEALDKATGICGEGDGVLVTGSLYLVGAARDRYVPAPV